MKKYIFGFSWGFNKSDDVKTEVEYEDDVSEKQIAEDYQSWLWDNVVGDKVYWYEIKD